MINTIVEVFRPNFNFKHEFSKLQFMKRTVGSIKHGQKLRTYHCEVCHIKYMTSTFLIYGSKIQFYGQNSEKYKFKTLLLLKCFRSLSTPLTLRLKFTELSLSHQSFISSAYYHDVIITLRIHQLYHDKQSFLR